MRNTVIVILIMLLMILASAWYHDAFGQDTTLVDVGTYDVNLGNGKHVRISGDGDVYRDTTGVLKRGSWTPKADTAGTYIWSIREDLTIRASRNPAGYRIDYKNKYLEFLFANNSYKVVTTATLDTVNRGFKWSVAGGSYFELTVSHGRLKEKIYSPPKRNKFNFIINTNLNRLQNKFERFQIMNLVTVDSLMKSLPTTFTITTSNDSLFGQALVDTVGALFPITIDPSIIDTTTTAYGFYVNGLNDGTYLTARNKVVGDNVSPAEMQVGQNKAGTDYTVRRGFLKFPLNDLVSVTIDSAKLLIDGKDDQSASDFQYNVYSARDSAYSQFYNNAKAYNNFPGWKVSGAYTQDTLATSLNSSAYSATWNILKFTAAGCDTIEAQIVRDDTARFAILSYNDITATAPTASEFIEFATEGGAILPRLIVYYTTNAPPLYAVDSIAFGVWNDSTLRIDSLATGTNDATAKYSILNISARMWLNPSVRRMDTVEVRLAASNWDAKNFRGFIIDTTYGNFNHKFKVFSFDAGETADSTKSKLDSLVIGTPTIINITAHDTVNIGAGEIPGRWNVKKKKPRE